MILLSPLLVGCCCAGGTKGSTVTSGRYCGGAAATQANLLSMVCKWASNLYRKQLQRQSLQGLCTPVSKRVMVCIWAVETPYYHNSLLQHSHKMPPGFCQLAVASAAVSIYPLRLSLSAAVGVLQQQKLAPTTSQAKGHSASPLLQGKITTSHSAAHTHIFPSSAEGTEPCRAPVAHQPGHTYMVTRTRSHQQGC